MRKIITQTQTEGHATKYLTRTPQNCQGHEKQGKSEKLSQIGGDPGDRKNKYNMASWIGSWNRKRTLVEKREKCGQSLEFNRILIKVNCSALTNAPRSREL